MRQKTLPFIGIMVIGFVAFLDYMIVNNALPRIQEVFQVSILDLQWVSNVYCIVVASTLILFGRISDMFGYRRILYTGIFLLMIGSLGAGLAHQFDWLIFFRAVQSLGISIVIVLAPGLIQLIFQDKSHMPMSIYASIGGIGLLIGPYLGGVILTYLGWKWVFLINIPVLLIGTLLCAPFIAKFNNRSHRVAIDWAGNILLLTTLVSLIYALVHLEQVGLNKITLASFIIFALSLPLLIYVEKRQEHPNLNFNFFKHPDFMLAILINAMAGTLVACGMFFSPIFLQIQMGLSPTKAGTILLAFAIGIVVFSPLIGKLTKKILERKTIMFGLIAGLIAAIAYIGFFYGAVIKLGIIAFFLTGLCLAVNNTASALGAIKGVGEKNAGAAIGTIFSLFNTTSAIMIGITSVLLHSFRRHHSAQFSYAMVFVLIAVCALILFVAGWRQLKAKSAAE